ncbi:MAG: glycosyltransferase [Gammaproteobacteria bacterium]|nr:MAG: glycosyltransferase [Gammaproteobacteria bacterium]
MTSYYQQYLSPIGPLYLLTDGKALIAVSWQHSRDKVKQHSADLVEAKHEILSQTREQLEQYFTGQRTQFDLPLAFAGTQFQQAAWHALLNIPYGQTRSYKQQAQSINNPKAMQAIGQANGRNPISIIVPCHRVIGQSGKLVGYAGGLENKMFLLDLEKNNQV